MSIAISSFNMFANRTLLRGVMWVNINNRYSLLKGFVFNKRAKLSKSPRMMDKSLFSCKLNPLPNMLQIFKHKDIIRLTSIDNSPADSVVDVSHPSSFFARQPSQEFFSSLSAFALQRLTEFRIMITDIFNLLTREFKTIRGGCKVINTSVNADRIRTRGDGDFFFQRKINVKSLLRFLISKCCRGWFLPFKEPSLKITERKLQLQSAINGCKRNAFFFLNKAKKVFIKAKGLCFKSFRSALPFHTDPCNSPDNIVSSKVISIFNYIVAEMMKFISIPNLFFFCNSKNIVTGLGKFRDSIKDRLLFLTIHFKFTLDCFNKFHRYINTIIFLKSQVKSLQKEMELR